MNNIKNVLICLTPLDYYFFGGRRTFGGDNANYFVRSRYFPQQTSIIGLLRYQLLQKGQAIGESFDAANLAKQTFGALQKLSPVFLYGSAGDVNSFSPNQIFWPHPLDAQVDEKDENRIEPFAFSASKNASLLASGGKNTWQAAPVISGYDPKVSLIEERYANGSGEVVKGEAVFSSTVRVGITKRRRGRPKPDDKEKERGFYKQEVYKLKQGWSFGVLAEFDSTFDPLALDGAVTPFGGERSLFRINVSAADKTWSQVDEALNGGPFAPADGNKLILLSDALVEAGIYRHCAAAITQTVDFQNIHTPKGKEVRYAALTNKEEEKGLKLYKSGQYQLLARGSVLFAAEGQLSGLIGAFENANNFRTIGYNQFIIR